MDKRYDLGGDKPTIFYWEVIQSESVLDRYPHTNLTALAVIELVQEYSRIPGIFAGVRLYTERQPYWIIRRDHVDALLALAKTKNAPAIQAYWNQLFEMNLVIDDQ